MEKKSFLVTEAFALFLGFLGVHRYYTGYIGIGIAQTLTLGGCGIWALIDLIFISVGKYKDAKGQELEGYDKNIGIGALVLYAVFWLFCSNFHPISKTTINNYNQRSNMSEKNREVTFSNAKCTVFRYGHMCSGTLSDEDKAELERIKAELKQD